MDMANASNSHEGVGFEEPRESFASDSVDVVRVNVIEQDGVDTSNIYFQSTHAKTSVPSTSVGLPMTANQTATTTTTKHDDDGDDDGNERRRRA